MILVLLGTQNNSFHRLLKEIERCIDANIIGEEVIVQAGGTKFESTKMKIFDLIPKKELEEYVNDCHFMITHGGVGSILEGLRKNKKVIAVARQKQYEEHVNDHQIQIVENFDSQGYIKGITDLKKLGNAIAEIEDFEPKEFVSNTHHVIEVVEKFIEETGGKK